MPFRLLSSVPPKFLDFIGVVYTNKSVRNNYFFLKKSFLGKFLYLYACNQNKCL